MHEELIFLVLILMWVCESSDNMEDNFEDTKCVFRGRKSKKNRPGVDPGGGAHPARAPPKIGKNMIFWRKIVIFHTKYPKNFRAPLRSAQFF